MLGSGADGVCFCCVKRRVASAGPLSEHNSAFDIRTVRDRIRVGEEAARLLRNLLPSAVRPASPGPDPPPLLVGKQGLAPTPRSAVDDRRVEPRLGRPPGQGSTPRAPHTRRYSRLYHHRTRPPRHRLRPRRQRVAVAARTYTGPGEPSAGPSPAGVPGGADRGGGEAPQDSGGSAGGPEGWDRWAPGGTWRQLSTRRGSERGTDSSASASGEAQAGHTSSPGARRLAAAPGPP